MSAAALDGVARELAQLRARRLPVGVRRVDAGELHRRIGDLDLAIRKRADGIERGRGSLMPPAPCRGSLIAPRFYSAGSGT